MKTFEKRKGLYLWEALRCTKHVRVAHSTVLSMVRGIFMSLVVSIFCIYQTVAAENITSLTHSIQPSPSQKRTVTVQTLPVSEILTKRANFKQESASPQSRSVANWVVNSGDNQNMPFLIIDKNQAKVFAFAPNGQLRGAAPVLLGLALGDDSIPGIGDRALSNIRPEDRVTPAGRFVASLGRDIHGKEILWVDYDSAIALHRVITSNPKERRLQRLSSPTALEHRISYGCINVPVKFYDSVVSPAFTKTNGIVYVLPEIHSAHDVFGYYDPK
jgi:hypothetical protein